MTDDTDFDPKRTGGALLVLESELRDELSSKEPEQALRRLRLELVLVIRRARAWAERRGVPSRFVPESPPPESGPQECVALLRDLAAALQFLGARDEIPSSMIEVVAWLKMHGSEALAELNELGEVVDELARALGALETATRTLNEMLAGAASVLNGSAPKLSPARTQASTVHELAQLLLDAIEELQLRFAMALGEPSESEAR
jgi:hypothetical protein